MSPASTASGRANANAEDEDEVPNCRRKSAQLRCEPMSRWDMCVPATEIGCPSTVRSTTNAARRTRSARRVRIGNNLVASIGSEGRTRTAMPQLPSSASCQRGNACTRADTGRTPSMYNALFWSFQMGRGLQLAVVVLLASAGTDCGRIRRPEPSVCAAIWYPRCRAASAACPPASSPATVHASSSTMTSASSEAMAAR